MMTGGLVTLGETMVMFRGLAIGSAAHESEFRLAIGGAESNVAIGVSRLGGAATWIGRVGADSFGERVTRELLAERVRTHALVDELARTGLMVKERLVGDVTRVSYYRSDSAGSRLAPGDLEPDLIRSAGVLHVTGITPALSDTAHATIRAAMDIAADAGTLISFDVNHRSGLWSRETAVPIYRELARRSDILFAGDDEAAMIVGDGSPDQLAARLEQLGPAQVVIKLGARGCLALVDGLMRRVPAIPIRPVDTVGAGDAFVAGYVAELLEGRSVEQCLDTAVRTGAFACLGPGDWESYPRRSQLVLLDGGDPVLR